MFRYEIHDGYTHITELPGFYWRDNASPQGFGPFGSIYQCVEHYKWVIQATKHRFPKQAALIRIDFKQKRRNIPEIPDT